MGDAAQPLTRTTLGMQICSGDGYLLFHFAEPEDLPEGARLAQADLLERQLRAARALSQARAVARHVGAMLHTLGPRQEECDSSEWFGVATQHLADLAEILGITIPDSFEDSGRSGPGESMLIKYDRQDQHDQHTHADHGEAGE